MKYLALVVAYLAAPSIEVGVAAASLESASGNAGENAISEVTAELNSAAEEIKDGRRRLGYSDTNSDLDGTSCDCSKDAQMEIWTTYKEVLDTVSPTFMGLLDENSDVLSDSLGGIGYYPKYDYKRMLPSLKYLVNIAIDTLRCMQCGPCEEYGHGHGRDNNSTMPTPFEGISHDECCCDVNLIRDLALKNMRSVVAVVTLNPGASDFTEPAQESITEVTGCTIKDIARPYECEELVCPCFTIHDLEYANKESEFDVCQYIGDADRRRKIVDFDIELHVKETSYAFCVGDNCEKHCDVKGPTNSCAYHDEIPDPEGLKCYHGIAYLGKPYPYHWHDGLHMSRKVNDEEYDACCKVIEEFCHNHNFSPPDKDDIEGDSDYADPDDV